MMNNDIMPRGSRALSNFKAPLNGSHAMTAAQKLLSYAADATAIFFSVVTVIKIIQSILYGDSPKRR